MRFSQAIGRQGGPDPRLELVGGPHAPGEQAAGALEDLEHALDHLPLPVGLGPFAVEFPAIELHRRGRLGDQQQVLGLEVLPDLRRDVAGVGEADSPQPGEQPAFDGSQIMGGARGQVPGQDPSVAGDGEMELEPDPGPLVGMPDAGDPGEGFGAVLEEMAVDLGRVDEDRLPPGGPPRGGVRQEIEQERLDSPQPMRQPLVAEEAGEQPPERRPRDEEEPLEVMPSISLEEQGEGRDLRERHPAVRRAGSQSPEPEIVLGGGLRPSQIEIVELDKPKRGGIFHKEGSLLRRVVAEQSFSPKAPGEPSPLVGRHARQDPICEIHLSFPRWTHTKLEFIIQWKT